MQTIRKHYNYARTNGTTPTNCRQNNSPKQIIFCTNRQSVTANKLVRGWSCNYPFCAMPNNAQRDLRLPSRLSFRQVSKKQITAPICEETTKTVSAKTVIFHLTFVLHRKRHTQRSFIRSFRVCLNGFTVRNNYTAISLKYTRFNPFSYCHG